MARAELADLVQRYRAVWRECHRQPERIFHWTTPRRVWAIDCAEAPAIIDGRFPYLQAVRDLASSMQLLSQLIESATAEAAVRGLARFFALYDAPLGSFTSRTHRP